MRGGFRQVGILLAGLAAAAGVQAEVRRALSESPEAKATLATVKPELLAKEASLKDCGPARHKSKDAVDWACKVGALRVLAAQETVDPMQPFEKNKGLQKRARLVGLALDTADALGFYQPGGEPNPELPKWQVAAQLEACQAAQELFSAVLDIPEGKPAAASLAGLPQKDAPRLAKPLKRVACDCFERTVAMGRAGFLSEREAGLARAQKQTFSLGCNLNTTGRETSLVDLKKEKSDVDLSSHGGSARAADVDKDEAQRVADRRKKELVLCTDASARGAAAEEKVERCACPLMQRWRFPKREVEGVLTIQVAVAEKLSPVTVEIGQKGTVDRCYVGKPPAAAP